MAELHLIRHGQASFGAADYDRLSDVGTRQSHWLGLHLAEQGDRFDRVFIGSMNRHRQTAAALLDGLGCDLPIEEHAGLNEYDFQALLRGAQRQGLDLPPTPPGDQRAFFRALRHVLMVWSEGGLADPPETWQHFQQRVAAARGRIQACGAHRVLAISSGGAIAVMAQQVLQASAAAAIDLNLQLANSAVCRYFFNADTFRLSSFNTLSHLEQGDRRPFITYA